MSGKTHLAFSSLTMLFSCILSVTATCALRNDVNVLPQDTVQAEQPILELTVRCGGVCATDPKEILMRLYKNGQADTTMYDFSMQRQVLKRLSLLPEDVRNLISLAQSRDFLKSNARYEKLTRYDDAWYLYTIRYEQEPFRKTVEIVNYNLNAPNARKFYPRGLVALLERIKQLRRRYLNKR